MLLNARRNLGRNPKRTGITLAAVALTTAVLIVSFGLLEGLMRQVTANITSVTIGEVQAHAPGWLDDRSMYASLDRPDGILAAARRAGLAAAPRSYAVGLVAHGPRSSGALFYGVDPAAERGAFTLPDRIRAGSYLPEAPRRGLVLGHRIAELLDATPGAEVVVMAQAADGSLANDLFTVAGILSPSGSQIDHSAALLHRDDFAELFVTAGRVHEIVLTSHGSLPPGRVAAFLRAAAPGAEVRTWRERLPVYADIVRITSVTLWMFGLVFLLAGGLGVMNTMLMAAHERVREFGLMKALGTPPAAVMGMVAAEAVLLCAAAAAAGAGLGAGAALLLRATGIGMGVLSREFPSAHVVFDPVLRPVLEPGIVLLPAAAMCVVGLLASLYPASWAARRDPARTMEAAR